jgi:hypothetical protein
LHKKTLNQTFSCLCYSSFAAEIYWKKYDDWNNSKTIKNHKKSLIKYFNAKNNTWSHWFDHPRSILSFKKMLIIIQLLFKLKIVKAKGKWCKKLVYDLAQKIFEIKSELLTFKPCQICCISNEKRLDVFWGYFEKYTEEIKKFILKEKSHFSKMLLMDYWVICYN